MSAAEIEMSEKEIAALLQGWEKDYRSLLDEDVVSSGKILGDLERRDIEFLRLFSRFSSDYMYSQVGRRGVHYATALTE